MTAGTWIWIASGIIWGAYLWATCKTRRINYQALEPRKMQAGDIVVLFHGRTPFWKVWKPMRVNVEVATDGLIFMTLHNATAPRATTAALTALSCGVKTKRVAS